MDESLYSSILLTVVEALQRPPSDRLAFLRAKCADDEEMFTRTSSLLPSVESHSGGRSTRTSPSEEGRSPSAPSSSPLAFSLSAIEQLAASIRSADDFPARVGPYTLLRRLGHGGMGDVFLAEVREPEPLNAEQGAATKDELAGSQPRRVALKLLRPGMYSDEAFARFRQEAEILSGLNHAGIARIHDSGTAQVENRTYPYIALEYVEGTTLREVLRNRELSAPQSARLLRDICRAVEHAHTAGVVHRDLKPENIMIDREGRPHILDFGVARLRRDDRVLGSRTETSAVLGTPAYMSPEQLRREHDRVDARSDVFALGVIGFELLAGRHPFAVGRGMAAIEAADVLTREPPGLRRFDPAIHRDLDIILGRALEKRAAERFANAGAMADDLDRHLSDKRLTPATRSPGRAARRWTRRHPAAYRSLVGIGSLLLIAAIALAARMSAAPVLDPETVYAKASSDIDEADRLIFIAEWSDQNKRDGIKLLEGARVAISKVPERPYTPHFYAYIYRRMAEATIHIYSPKRDRAGLESARGYLLQAAKWEWEADGLRGLPERHPLFKKLRENTRHAPASLIRMVTSQLAELDRPVAQAGQATIYAMQALDTYRALGLKDYGSPDVGYSVSGYDKALLLAGVGDAIRQFGWANHVQETHDACFPYFAEADTVHALTWWPDSHSSFLEGYGLAHLERAEMSGNIADLDSARALFERNFEIRTKASGGPGYASTMTKHARTWLIQSRLSADAAERLQLLDQAAKDILDARSSVTSKAWPVYRAEVELQAAEIFDELALRTQDQAPLASADSCFVIAAAAVKPKSYPVLYCDLLAGRAHHERIRWQLTGAAQSRKSALHDIEDAAARYSSTQYTWLHVRLNAERNHLKANITSDQGAR